MQPFLTRWNTLFAKWPAAALVLVVVLFRILPHPVNFAPTLALAWNLHRWSSVSSKFTLGLVLFLACLGGDWAVNSLLYNMDAAQNLTYLAQPGVWVFYLTYGLLFLMGPLASRPGLSGTLVRVPLASLLFFVVSNTTVWLWGGMYPTNLGGWVTALVAGLPFLPMALTGDVLYTALFRRLSPVPTKQGVESLPVASQDL
jgi:hypothetical protein